MTSNHGYNTPAKGSTDWHIPLNDNFELIDTDVEIRDVESARSEYAPKQDAKFLATDTGAVYLGDGNQWTLLGQLSTSSGGSVNVVFANQFDGGDLCARVRKALDSLPGGRGRVIIPPKDDGTAWSWDSELQIDKSVFKGVHLDFVSNAAIDYTGSGWPITVTASSSSSDDRRTHITGGQWTFSGDPDGWCRIKDVYGTEVSPDSVIQCTNSSKTATAVSVENHDYWTETTCIHQCRLEADRCIDFKPASVTGGTGTDSFHETYIAYVDTRGRDFGIRTRGNMDYSHLNRVTFKAGASGWTGLILDHDFMRGAVVTAAKFEDNGGRSNTTGVSDPNGRAWYGPLFIGPFMNAVDTEWDVGSELAYLSAWEGKGLFVNAPANGHEWQFNSDSGELE